MTIRVQVHSENEILAVTTKGDVAQYWARAAAESATEAEESAQNAADIVSRFDTHATQTQAQFDANAETKTTSFNTNVDTQTTIFNTNAAQKQAQITQKAIEAEIWAEGTDAQVQALGGVHSSKVWAEQSENATTALSNLSAEGEKHFLNKTQITNCILEAPQMVDLELTDGTLTLKAGSKVIVPYGISAPTMSIGDSLNGGTIVDISWDGAKLFYVVQTTANHSGGVIDTVSRALVVAASGGMTAPVKARCFSGTTEPSITGSTSNLWYDTANNITKMFDGTSWNTANCSLPIAYYDQDGIDETFQHIGYIGSIIWAMKGTRILIPNGKNEDETHKNTDTTLNTVKMFAVSGTTQNRMLRLGVNSIGEGGLYYDIESNYNRLSKGGAIRSHVNAGSYSCEDSKVTALNARYPILLADIQTVNSSIDNLQSQIDDTAYIATQSFPSDSIVSLTVSSDSSSYTVPADGWLCATGACTSTSHSISIWRASTIYGTKGTAESNIGSAVVAILPVSKGKSYSVNFYNITDKNVRFIYANGSN